MKEGEQGTAPRPESVETVSAANRSTDKAPDAASTSLPEEEDAAANLEEGKIWRIANGSVVQA